VVKKKKTPFRPISLFHRRVVFDGKRELKCEVCGVSGKLSVKPRPESPKACYDWTESLNSKVLGFLEKHRGCK